MTPLWFDLIIVTLVLLSVGLGFLRGFCSEIFTMIGWVGAVLATIYFQNDLKPIGRDFIKSPWLADLATASAIFIVTMGLFAVVSHFATRGLHATKLGIIDRILGFGFGFLRAIILLGLAFFLYAYAYDVEERPDFVTEAHTTPMLEASAHWVAMFVPDIKVRISKEDPPVEKKDDKKKGKAEDDKKSSKDEHTFEETETIETRNLAQDAKDALVKGIKDRTDAAKK